MNAVAFLCMAVAVWLRATSIQVNAFTQVNASAEVDAYTYVEAPAFERAWENPPARFEVGANVRQAQVFDEAGREVPCKVQQHRDRRFVFWTRRDDGTAARRYAISLGAKSSFPPPVAVGAGDVFEYGRKKVIDDLAVGMWATPMPIDWDGDGDLDLLVSGTDRPQDGVYVYYRIRRNLYERGERLGDGSFRATLADMNGDGHVDLLTWNFWYDNIRENGFRKKAMLPEHLYPGGRIIGYTLRQVDWDGDSLLDLITAGTFQPDKGKDVGYDASGNWTGTHAYGWVWFCRNVGTNQEPVYDHPVQLEAEERSLEVFGDPSPCVADWDDDGDLDMVCGEFRDEFTYFENIGTRTAPYLIRGRPLMTKTGKLHIDLCMMAPTMCDWNGDGRLDLVVGQEDGRVSVIINEGLVQGAPQFKEERFLEELNPPLKAGGLARPWMDEMTGDLCCGNTAGYIEYFAFRNGSYRNGRNVMQGKETFRIQAGYHGSPQGPEEEKWGYTVPVLGDIDNDGVDEIVLNSCLGKIEYLERNGKRGGKQGLSQASESPSETGLSLFSQTGNRVPKRGQSPLEDSPGTVPLLPGTIPVFKKAWRVGPRTPVQVTWGGEPLYPPWRWPRPGPKELVVQWRSRPNVVDWDHDGLNDLVAQDHEGYLAWYRCIGDVFAPGRRVFKDEQGAPLRLNERTKGKGGRTKLHLVDWDGDGDFDLLRDSAEGGIHVGWFENTGDATFIWRGAFPGRELAGHSNAPQAVDWNRDGTLDLIVGAEDGRIYAYHRAALDEPDKLDATAIE